MVLFFFVSLAINFHLLPKKRGSGKVVVVACFNRHAEHYLLPNASSWLQCLIELNNNKRGKLIECNLVMVISRFLVSLINFKKSLQQLALCTHKGAYVFQIFKRLLKRFLSLLLKITSNSILLQNKL